MKLIAALAAALVASGALATGAFAHESKAPPLYENCTASNSKYAHGIGRAGARDHVSSGSPVTSFTRSTKLYTLALSFNRGLDRDHDGIACERD